jgi:hypothetical protein
MTSVKCFFYQRVCLKFDLAFFRLKSNSAYFSVAPENSFMANWGVAAPTLETW